MVLFAHNSYKYLLYLEIERIALMVSLVLIEIGLKQNESAKKTGA
jgi:hypothetical protein